MALTTADLVKQRADITGDSHDDLVAAVIAGVSMAIANWCRRAKAGVNLLELQEAREEYHDGGGFVLQLDCYPVVPPITSVTESFIRDFDHGVILLADSDYTLKPESGRLYRLNGERWCWGISTVQVIYDGGYLPADSEDEPEEGQIPMPADLTEAATQQAVHLFRNRDRLGLQTISSGGGSISIVTADLLPMVKSMLEPYRRFA